MNSQAAFSYKDLFDWLYAAGLALLLLTWKIVTKVLPWFRNKLFEDFDKYVDSRINSPEKIEQRRKEQEELKSTLDKLQIDIHSAVTQRGARNVGIGLLEEKLGQLDERIDKLFVMFGKLAEKIDSQNQEIPEITTSKLAERFNKLQKENKNGRRK